MKENQNQKTEQNAQNLVGEGENHITRAGKFTDLGLTY